MRAAHGTRSAFQISILSVLLVSLLPCGASASVHPDDYLAETLVFVTVPAYEMELEYWLDLGTASLVGGSFNRHNVAMEFGITDHFMADWRISAEDSPDSPLGLTTGRLETRYRLFEEGTLPVDIAFSMEVNAQRRPGETTEAGIEPRLILSRDLGGLNFTLNLSDEIGLGGQAPEPDAAFGFRYDLADTPVRAGFEVKRSELTGTRSILPQIWVLLPHDMNLKLGFSTPLHGRAERWARVALEAEF